MTTRGLVVDTNRVQKHIVNLVVFTFVFEEHRRSLLVFFHPCAVFFLAGQGRWMGGTLAKADVRYQGVVMTSQVKDE